METNPSFMFCPLLVSEVPVDRVRVVVLCTTPDPGQTSLACQRAGSLLESMLGTKVTLVDCSRLPVVAAGSPLDAGCDGLTETRCAIAEADLVVVGTRVVRSQVAGWCRNWIEVFRTELAAKTVIPIVAAGSVRATLVGDAFRSDLFVNFATHPTRPVVFCENGSTEELDRLEQVLIDTVAAARDGLGVRIGAR